MEKVMDDLKLGEAKQESLFNLMDEVESKASEILSFPLHWKSLDLQYESMNEALRQHLQELALQATKMEEARKRSELHETEVQVNLETAHRELNLLDLQLDSKKEELQLKERDFRFVRERVEDCEAELERKEMEIGVLEKKLTEIRQQICEGEGERDRILKCNDELESKEKLLDSIRITLDELELDVRRKREELCSLEKSLVLRHDDNLVSNRTVEIDAKEKDLAEVSALVNKLKTESELNERHLIAVVNELSGCRCQLEEEERKLAEVKTSIMNLSGVCKLKEGELSSVIDELQEKQQLLEFVSKALEVNIGDVSAKERELCLLQKEVQNSVNAVSVLNSECEEKEKELDEVKENLGLKETALSSIQAKINESSKELDSMKEQTICVKMLIEEFALALESGVKKTVEVAGERMKQWCGRLESRKTELVELRNKVIEGFKSREEELVRKEKLMEGVVAEIEAKEKQLSNLFDEHRNKQQPETAKELLGAIGCDSTSTPDSLLSEPKSQPCLTDIAVSTVTNSSDPARMTFHLLEQSFSRPVTDITAVRDRILFLEQFMAVSQTVGPELKEEAKELAATWRGNLSHCSSTDDVLAYLLFLAAFGISSYFKAEDTLELVPVIAHSERAPELCRSLDLAKCIPGLIANLCKKNKHMDAIRFSSAFDMVKDCPPDLILRDHLKKTKIFEDGRDLLESQHQALNTHLDSLKALSQGVARLGHNPGSLIGMISYHLEVLDKKLEKKKISLLAAGISIKSPNQNVHHLGGTTVYRHNNSPVNSTGEELRNKRQKH